MLELFDPADDGREPTPTEPEPSSDCDKPEPVELEPGAKAYFDLSYSAVPHENLGETRCPSVAEVIATAPGDTAEIPLELEIEPCGRQVRVSPLRPVEDGARPD